MEAHFVFENEAEDSLAVIGVLMQANSAEDNPYLEQFWGNFDGSNHYLDAGEYHNRA